jgi:hypothetical protein
MSGYNTDTALIHRNGLLQMLEKNKNQGPDFRALTALVNLLSSHLSSLSGVRIDVSSMQDSTRPFGGRTPGAICYPTYPPVLSSD